MRGREPLSSQSIAFPARNEKGMALITVLCFSAILIAMMTMVLNTTMIETLMSGASTTSKRALAAADSGIEYVKGTFVLIGSEFPSSSSAGNYTAEAHSMLPSPLNQRVTFLNLSSMGSDPAALVASGFSNKYVSPNGGGGPLKLQAYHSRINSRAAMGNMNKTVEFEGYSLAP